MTTVEADGMIAMIALVGTLTWLSTLAVLGSGVSLTWATIPRREVGETMIVSRPVAGDDTAHPTRKGRYDRAAMQYLDFLTGADPPKHQAA
jgi:hypothetical protein